MNEGIVHWIELAARGLELLAIAIIVGVILVATVRYLLQIASSRASADTYHRYRHGIARALLLGLEILVAADIIDTVALDPTLNNVLRLGLLVLIRTMLSWGLVVEIEERWPWQPKRREATGEAV